MYSSDTLLWLVLKTHQTWRLNTPALNVLCKTVKCVGRQGLSKTSYDLKEASHPCTMPIVLVVAQVTF